MISQACYQTRTVTCLLRWYGRFITQRISFRTSSWKPALLVFPDLGHTLRESFEISLTFSSNAIKRRISCSTFVSVRSLPATIPKWRPQNITNCSYYETYLKSICFLKRQYCGHKSVPTFRENLLHPSSGRSNLAIFEIEAELFSETSDTTWFYNPQNCNMNNTRTVMIQNIFPR
jgi:hypothetical protein